MDFTSTSSGPMCRSTNLSVRFRIAGMRRVSPHLWSSRQSPSITVRAAAGNPRPTDGNAPSRHGVLAGLLLDQLLVVSRVHQLVNLLPVRGLNLDEPARPVGIFVHCLRRVGKRIVHLEWSARADGAPYFGKLDVHHVPEFFLRVGGDADDDRLPLPSRPLVLLGVLQILGIFSHRRLLLQRGVYCFFQNGVLTTLAATGRFRISTSKAERSDAICGGT